MIFFLLMGCGERPQQSTTPAEQKTVEVKRPEELQGVWKGPEPIADPSTGWVRFDSGVTERPISLELRADGTAKGAARLLAFGRNRDNQIAEFRWRVESHNIFFQKEGEVVPVAFFYFQPNPNELYFSPRGFLFSGPYGTLSFPYYSDILKITEGSCSHQHNKRAEPYTAPCSYTEKEGYSVLEYKAKISTGTILDRTMHYYPEHKIIVSPPGYIFFR